MCVPGSHALYNQAVQGLQELCKLGHLHQSLQAMELMGQQGLLIPEGVWAYVMQGCIREKDLAAATQLGAMLPNHETPIFSQLRCQLIQLLALLGSLPEALQLFNDMEGKNVYAWTTIISVHVGTNPEQALALYKQMVRCDVKPGSHTIVATLKACVNSGLMKEGIGLHDDAVKEQLEADPYVSSALVDMYAKCGGLREALSVFDKLAVKDVVSCCSMMAGLIRHGCGLEALKLSERMRQQGIEPNKVTLVCLLKACTTILAVDEGRRLHAKIVKLGHEVDLFTGNTLIDMYAKFNCIEDAQDIFDKMAVRDVVSWNAMISGCADHHTTFGAAVSLFKTMQQEGKQPNTITYVCVLKACSMAGNLEEGELVHGELCNRGLESDLRVGSMLIDMYANCGMIVSARLLFDKSPNRDVVLWSTMISGYAQHGPAVQSLHLYRQMREAGIGPDKITLTCTLKACINLGSSRFDRLIHADILFQSTESDVTISSTLFELYFTSGRHEDALVIFHGLPTRNTPSFNLLLGGYADQGDGDKVIEMFENMESLGIEPDEVSFAYILKACSTMAALDQGRRIHGRIVEKGLDSDAVLGNTLVDMYAKGQSLVNAVYVFEQLSVRSVISWSALIGGFAECGCLQEAVSHYEAMRNDGVSPNEVTALCILKACTNKASLQTGLQIHIDITKQGFSSDERVGNCLIDMYIKCDHLDEACRVFEEVPIKSVVSWTSVIAGLAEQGDGEKALACFQKMELEGIAPNQITYVCILKACVNLAALDHGKRIHADIINRKLESGLSIGNTLIAMYSKCGSLEIAKDVFWKLHVRDVYSWNTMIGALAEHGHYVLAQHYFGMMQRDGVKPDDVTFVCLLIACSHAGLVPESCYYYSLMVHGCGLPSTAEHYVCVVDVLGRVGRLGDAEQFVLRLPSLPFSAVWLALLSSCAMLGNVQLGERAFQNLLKADQLNITAYVLMSNILATNDQAVYNA